MMMHLKLSLVICLMVSVLAGVMLRSTQASSCVGARTPHLLVDHMARVLPGDANDLYARPTADSQQIGQIPAGDDVFVIDGGVCAEGQYWWQVSYDGVIGWTPEGRGDHYWLEPLSVASAPTSTPQPNATPWTPPVYHATPTATPHPAVERA